MPVAFGRPAPPAFRGLAAHIDEILRIKPGDTQLRALAWNLQNDHRISKARAKTFVALWEREFKTNPKPSLSNALKQMLETQIRVDPAATFLHGSNSNNFVRNSIRKSRKSGPAAGPFATVLSVGAVARFASDAGVLRSDEAALFSMPRLNPQPDFYPNGIVKAGRENFVRLLAVRDRCIEKRGNPPRSAAPKNPCWAAVWDDFAQSIGTAAPASWKHSVGLPVRESGECLILFRYQVPPTIQLVRPTQLDAGNFSLHYPSPKKWPPQRGGCCVQAGPCGSGSESVFVREFIHEEFSLGLDQWKSAGEIVGDAGPIWVAGTTADDRAGNRPKPVSWSPGESRAFHEYRLTSFL